VSTTESTIVLSARKQPWLEALKQVGVEEQVAQYLLNDIADEEALGKFLAEHWGEDDHRTRQFWQV